MMSLLRSYASFLTFVLLHISGMEIDGGKGKEKMQKHIATSNYFRKFHKLNWHYYIHDDSNRHHTGTKPLIVRIGRAHFWQYRRNLYNYLCTLLVSSDVKGLKRPSELGGYTLSVNRTDHLDRLSKPKLCVYYKIPLDRVDEHVLGYLLPSMFEREGWNDDDQVLGVWVKIPENIDGAATVQTVTITIDFGQPKTSPLLLQILDQICRALKAKNFEFLYKYPSSKHSLADFRTLGSHDNNNGWILAVRNGHILCDIDLEKLEELGCLLGVLNAERTAGELLFTRRSEWPFDTESHPLTMKVAIKNEIVMCSIIMQLLHIRYDDQFFGQPMSLPSELIKAISFEGSRTSKSFFLTFWLANTIDTSSRDLILALERSLLTRIQLHKNFLIFDESSRKNLGWFSWGHTFYDPNVRHPYQLHVMNGSDTGRTVRIESCQDFKNIQQTEINPGGFTLRTLERSRLIFFHTSSPKFMQMQPTLLALVATCKLAQLPYLLSGCDWLVSHANFISQIMQLPPSAILIEPMEFLESNEPTKRGRRQQRHQSVAARKPELVSRFHFILPSTMVDSQGDAIWTSFHFLLRSCGIQEKLELITINSLDLSEIEVHKESEFAGTIETISSEFDKLVSGPTLAEIDRAKEFLKNPKLSLVQLRERSNKLEISEKQIDTENVILSTEVKQRIISEEEEQANKLLIERTAEIQKLELEEQRRKNEEIEAEKKAQCEIAKKEREVEISSRTRRKALTVKTQYIEPKVYQQKGSAKKIRRLQTKNQAELTPAAVPKSRPTSDDFASVESALESKPAAVAQLVCAEVNQTVSLPAILSSDISVMNSKNHAEPEPVPAIELQYTSSSLNSQKSRKLKKPGGVNDTPFQISEKVSLEDTKSEVVVLPREPIADPNGAITVLPNERVLRITRSPDIYPRTVRERRKLPPNSLVCYK